MSQPEDVSADAAQDHLRSLVRTAREACVDRPELLASLDELERLDDVDLAHRPAAFDAVHRVLRDALANAGRP